MLPLRIEVAGGLDSGDEALEDMFEERNKGNDSECQSTRI